MPRTRDDSRAAEAARLYASGQTTREIAAEMGVDPRTVARWAGDAIRRRGPRGRTDITDETIWSLRYGPEKLSYQAIADRTGLARTGVRKRLDRMTG